jgi:hemoglobin
MTRMKKILGLAAAGLFLVAGCATAPSTPKNAKSLYQRVGGLPAVKALVTGSLGRIIKDPRVNEYFKGFDLDPLTEHFIQLACVVTGGPCKYEGRGMKEVHQGMHITNAAFDAVIEDIAFTMKKLKVHQDKDIVEVK